MERAHRFLVVTLNAAGNWPPEIALVRTLVRRGHDVRVMSHDAHALEIADAGALFRPYDHRLARDPTQRRDESPEAEMARVMRDVFLNRDFGDALLAEVERDAPDVLLIDQMLLMAAAAAESTSLPVALLWHTVFGGRFAGPSPPRRALDPLNAYRAELGLDPVADQLAMTKRADAVLAFTHETFDRPLADRPPQLHYVGPLACAPQPHAAATLPWEPGDARPLVLISYSTSFQNQLPALQRIADAVATLPIRALLTLGPAIAPDELRLPPNVVAERFVPHAAVLPHTRLVVTHAGHGTVMAAVTAGVPLVCTPMGRDQHAVAACVEAAGLGVVASATASSEELRAAIARALDDHGTHDRARTFAARLDVNAGRTRAIMVLEGLGRGGAAGCD